MIWEVIKKNDPVRAISNSVRCWAKICVTHFTLGIQGYMDRRQSKERAENLRSTQKMDLNRSI